MFSKPLQGRKKMLLDGGADLVVAQPTMYMLTPQAMKGLGACSPRTFLLFECSEIISGAF